MSDPSCFSAGDKRAQDCTSLSVCLSRCRLVYSGKQASRSGLDDVYMFSTRSGTRHGVATHVFRVEQSCDLSLWSRALVDGAHNAAAFVKEVSCRECNFPSTIIFNRSGLTLLNAFIVQPWRGKVKSVGSACTTTPASCWSTTTKLPVAFKSRASIGEFPSNVYEAPVTMATTCCGSTLPMKANRCVMCETHTWPFSVKLNLQFGDVCAFCFRKLTCTTAQSLLFSYCTHFCQPRWLAWDWSLNI